MEPENRYQAGYVAGHRKGMADCEAEIERLRALLRPFVDMVAEPEDFAAARRALEEKS